MLQQQLVTVEVSSPLCTVHIEIKQESRGFAKKIHQALAFCIIASARRVRI